MLFTKSTLPKLTQMNQDIFNQYFEPEVASFMVELDFIPKQSPTSSFIASKSEIVFTLITYRIIILNYNENNL